MTNAKTAPRICAAWIGNGSGFGLGFVFLNRAPRVEDPELQQHFGSRVWGLGLRPRPLFIMKCCISVGKLASLRSKGSLRNFANLQPRRQRLDVSSSRPEQNNPECSFVRHETEAHLTETTPPTLPDSLFPS